MRWLWGRTSASNTDTPCSSRRLREVGEQDRAEAVALVGVRDLERDLGAVVVGVVAAERRVPDDRLPSAAERDEPEAAVVVDVRGPIGRAVEVHPEREEAQAARVGREALEELLQRLAVVGPHRAHVDGRPVAQHDVGLAMGRIGGAGACRGVRRHGDRLSSA